MKDPAALFYISDWLTSTSEMDADCRGWYLNLILHNYDKGDLPCDIEKLAVLAGVKFSEYNRFEQVFKQVLEQKFEKCENDRITNSRTSKIIQAREKFQEKRSNAGKLSYFYKFGFKTNTMAMTSKFKEFIKDNIDLDNLDTKNEHLLKQVFEHLFELYRNGNGNENKDEDVVVNKTWRNDFSIYLQEVTNALADLKSDDDWMQKQQQFNPTLLIVETLDKSFYNFWGTEAGWKNKKDSKTKTINWKSTFSSAISNSVNKVYKPKDYNQTTSIYKNSKGQILHETEWIENGKRYYGKRGGKCYEVPMDLEPRPNTQFSLVFNNAQQRKVWVIN